MCYRARMWRYIRILALLYVAFEYIDPTHGLVQAPTYAKAATIPNFSGPQDVSQMQAMLNQLVNYINQILAPLLPAVAGATNNLALVGAPSVSVAGLNGAIAAIGLQPGSDPNAPIGIQPNGNGNVVLWPGVPYGGDYENNTGVLQIDSSADFIAPPGVGACPGVPANRGPMMASGQVVSDHIRAFWVIQDWKGVQFGIPLC